MCKCLELYADLASRASVDVAVSGLVTLYARRALDDVSRVEHLSFGKQQRCADLVNDMLSLCDDTRVIQP